jgi:hypothetical protein
MVQLGEERTRFALEAVAPMSEAEAETEAGENSSEVVDGAYCSVDWTG